MFFRSLNPFVIFIYFISVIVFSSVVMHPVCQAISLLSSISFLFFVKNKNIKIRQITYLFFGALFVAFINPLFNHSGNTILFYLKSGNPFTLESIIFGISASVMLICVLTWFFSFNELITSEKIVYIFGKIVPSVSLFISMILRFIPKLKVQFKEIVFSQKCIGNSFSDKNFIGKIRLLFNILSILFTQSIENAVETSNSMKSRGYGTGKRTSFSMFSFCKTDIIILILMFILNGIIIYGIYKRTVFIYYFPIIRMSGYNFFNIIFYIFYLLLFFLPTFIEILGEIKWKKLHSRV